MGEGGYYGEVQHCGFDPAYSKRDSLVVETTPSCSPKTPPRLSVTGARRNS